MNDHDWLQENLETYLADGLDADERQRVETHIAACAECGARLKDARSHAKSMTDLLAFARPDATLEDRTLARLRKATIARPSWLRFAMAAAAVVMLGLIGAGVQAVVADTGLRFPGVASLGALRLAQAPPGSRDLAGLSNEAHDQPPGGRPPVVQRFDNTLSMIDTDLSYSIDRISDVSVSGKADPNALTPPINAPPGVSTKGGDIEKNQAQQQAPVDVNGALLGMRVPTDTYAFGFFDNARVDPSNTDWAARVTPQFGGYQPGGGGGGPQNAEGKFKVELRPETYFQPPQTAKPGAPPPPSKGPAIVVPAPSPIQEKIERKLEPPSPDPNLAINQQPDKVEQPPQPETPGLKIIRTGDLDFEVESYDVAYKNINKLLAGVKGGFLLREDSKKQENGKKRGTVVVRMPPQFLEKFVEDLRTILEKAGELKSQRIGTQDVTRQFNDTESELKAARLVEKRLLQIIETGKGEVKDLIAAERELGTWRTKIEKMEGEIRYLANQVALSTLTINLVEKSIQTAAGMVVSEKVLMRVEVEEVAKAKDAAVKAVEDLKGRLVKADFKQEKGGQLEAIVHAEIPPDKKDAFRDAMKKLGIISEHEEAQSQKAEGGTKSASGIKRRTEDVLFEITLNNIVGINPRHAVVLVLATNDVAANYKKLEDAIKAAQGRVQEGKLNDPDKQRITAVLRFDVPTEQKAALDKLIAEFGPVLKRNAEEASAKEKTTEQRYGFAVYLHSVATIPPREKIVMKVIDVKDVKATADRLVDFVRGAKGHAEKPAVVLTPQGERTAIVVLKVPLAAVDNLMREIKSTGREIASKQENDPDVPEHDLATAQVTVSLTGGSPIVPTDQGLWPRIRSGLYLSFQVFAWCITVVIIGIAGVLPWVILIWIGYKAFAWFMAPKPAVK